MSLHLRVLISEPDKREDFIELRGQMKDYEILKEGLAVFRIGRFTTSCEEGVL